MNSRVYMGLTDQEKTLTRFSESIFMLLVYEGLDNQPYVYLNRI